MRAAMDALPDGTYRFEDFMEWAGGLLPVRVAVTVGR